VHGVKLRERLEDQQVECALKIILGHYFPTLDI
jgi:hypothetical protein